MPKNKRHGNKNHKNNAAIDGGESEKVSIEPKVSEAPWFMSQTVTGLAVIVSLVVLYLKDNPVDINASALLLDKNDLMTQCGLVMANSSLPDTGWGMFPLQTVKEHSPVSLGDPIIQIPDIPSTQATAIGHLVHNYLWSGDVTGGIQEGFVVYSLVPGVGSLANGHPTQWNIAPSNGARVSHAGITRDQSPGAGAFTHYHDFAFFAYGKDIRAGEEIMVNYGVGWLGKIPHDKIVAKRPLSELRRDGICLDHIRPGVSEIPHAGRGAFATRFLPRGAVVAPLPLLPIRSKEALKMDSGHYQLLLNYCLGHKESSLLLIPYATVVNLINHDDKNPNVEMRWSESTLHLGKQLLEGTLEDIWQSPNGLLLELVALHDIQPGEEILVNYGSAWQEAWNLHMLEWKPQTNPYVYATEYNERIERLLTLAELQENPYPPNVRTMCFYNYDPSLPRTEWNFPEQIREFKYLHPCHVLERNHEDNSYTVVLSSQESPILRKHTIPPNYIVYKVPRSAILLDDVIKSSDQHLVGAFRHEIHIPDVLFPKRWRDLA